MFPIFEDLKDVSRSFTRYQVPLFLWQIDISWKLSEIYVGKILKLFLLYSTSLIMTQVSENNNTFA